MKTWAVTMKMMKVKRNVKLSNSFISMNLHTANPPHSLPPPPNKFPFRSDQSIAKSSQEISHKSYQSNPNQHSLQRKEKKTQKNIHKTTNNNEHISQNVDHSRIQKSIAFVTPINPLIIQSTQRHELHTSSNHNSINATQHTQSRSMENRKQHIKKQIDAFTASFQDCRTWRLSELTLTELSLLLDRLESLGEHITTIEASFDPQMSSYRSNFGVNSSRAGGKKMDIDEYDDGEQLFSSEFKRELNNTKTQVKQQIATLTQFHKTQTLNKGLSESEVLAASLVSQVSQHNIAKKKETRGRKKGSTAAKLEAKRRLQRQDSVSSVDSTCSRSSTGSNRSNRSTKSNKSNKSSKEGKAGKISKKNGNSDIDDALSGEDMCGNHPDRCCACGTRIYIKGRSHWTHGCDCKHNFHLKCVSRSDFPFSTTVCGNCNQHAPLVKVLRPPGGTGGSSKTSSTAQTSSALSARGKIQKLVSVEPY
eukprot:TRINITY_DN4182_c0_g1_i4.p1 TRINITY_DN4182_c0_g1~~TRINITY_DN4182_c0_g1_i4.p1  ORF type:complete len:477 (-),score=84.94 TRINITY_DN4182_c0_g1_i4:59-1489(-)